MKADAIAQVPGKPLPRVDLRPGDDRTFTVDCSQLLRQHELLVRMELAESASGHLVAIEKSRTRGGIMIELQLAVPRASTVVKHEDVKLTLVAVTTQGRLRLTVVARVHE
jgi:hypothetical protein